MLVRTGEKAAAERAIGNDTDVEFLITTSSRRVFSTLPSMVSLAPTPYMSAVSTCPCSRDQWRRLQGLAGRVCDAGFLGSLGAPRGDSGVHARHLRHRDVRSLLSSSCPILQSAQSWCIECATAGHRVGYESASQFSREYRRLFGAPPRAEIARLREAGVSA